MSKLTKVITLVFVLFVVNFIATFYFINLFRKDYALGMLNLIAYHSIIPIVSFLVLNGLFISIGVIVSIKGNRMRESRIANGFFSVEAKTSKFLTVLILVSLLYGIGFVMTLVHEFGHGIARILAGGYFNRIVMELYNGGYATYHVSSLTPLVRSLVSLSGYLAEVGVSIPLLLILFSRRKESKFIGLLLILLMIPLIGTLGYFTIFPLFGLHSDTLTIAEKLNIHPFIMSLIFLPQLIIAIVITVKFVISYYKTTLERNKAFLIIAFISLAVYFVLLGTITAIHELIVPLPPLLAIY